MFLTSHFSSENVHKGSNESCMFCVNSELDHDKWNQCKKPGSSSWWSSSAAVNDRMWHVWNAYTFVWLQHLPHEGTQTAKVGVSTDSLHSHSYRPTTMLLITFMTIFSPLCSSINALNQNQFCHFPQKVSIIYSVQKADLKMWFDKLQATHQ